MTKTKVRREHLADRILELRSQLENLDHEERMRGPNRYFAVRRDMCKRGLEKFKKMLDEVDHAT